MQTKFTWEGFENRELSVDLKLMNDSDKMEFLKECENRGYIGASSGKKPTEMMDYLAIRVDDKGTKTLEQYSSITNVVYAIHAIDCSVAENLLMERARMCKGRMCSDCPLSMNKIEMICGLLADTDPKRYIEIVQSWSDDHPIESVATYLDKLLEVFPNVALNSSGAPRLCRGQFENTRTDCKDFTSCKECWSQPYKGE